MSATVDAFGDDWSLPVDDLRLWVSLQEIASHAVLTHPPRAHRARVAADVVRGRLPAQPRRAGRQAGRPRPDRHRRPRRPPAGARRSRGAARRHPVAGPAGPAAPARRPRGHDHRLRRPHRRRGRPRASWPPRRGSPRRSGGAGWRPTSPTSSSSACSASRSRRRRSSGATPSWPACSSATATWAGCGSRPTVLPTPAEVDAPGLWLARIDL